MKGKLFAVLFIVVFALLIGVVFSLLNDGTDATDISDFRLGTESTESHVLVTPPPVSQTPTPEAEPTWLPLPSEYVATPAPTPTPTPIPTPTPTPIPIVTDLGAGQFRSNSPVYLNVIADWKATAVDANSVLVTVTVSAESYQLHLDAAQGAVNIKLGEEYLTLDGPALYYEGGLGVNQLASTSFTLPLPVGASNSYDLAVVWHFGGMYMNMEIPSLECGGVINLVR